MLSNSYSRVCLLLAIPAVMSACTDESILADTDRQVDGFICDVVQVAAEHADQSPDEFFSCRGNSVRLELDPEFEQEHWELLTSGRARLEIDREPGMLDGGVIPASEITIVESGSVQAASDSVGDDGSSVLVVRVVTTDVDPNGLVSEAEMYGNIFGGPDDNVNLKSQIEGCSHGKHAIQPAVVPGPHPGVMTVSVDQTAAGSESSALADAAAAQAQTQLGLDGPVESRFDHVLYCMPPGTNGEWRSWAEMNSSRSVYNQDWCSSASAPAHEFGHNMGLRHTNRHGRDRADTVGHMGYKYIDDETPSKCFNAARSSQLGWFADREVMVEAGTSGEYELIGAVDYPQATGEQQVLLKIVSFDGSRVLHIGYNVGTGPNAGTDATRRHVNVVEQEGGGSSTHLAALTEGSDALVVGSFGNPAQKVTVQVLSRPSEPEVGSATVDVATVQVTYTDERGRVN
ncbi:MAG: hypothetical protein K0V04_12315 [Deltaproteobacteria bacterium]|nr:hypothetical protein [Deltaproteobacteria bacterium]